MVFVKRWQEIAAHFLSTTVSEGTPSSNTLTAPHSEIQRSRKIFRLNVSKMELAGCKYLLWPIFLAPCVILINLT